MSDFTANYFVTINYKPKQGWGSPTSWDDVNKEIDDFMRRLTIELKGKKFWKRYAASGNERLIKGHGEIHFGITGEFPHAHIYLQKPDWCDDVAFVNTIHKIARQSGLSKKDASAVDVRRCDYLIRQGASTMSLSKKPTTVKELKAALAALKDADKVTVYEAHELRNKLPAISVLVQQGKTVIVV